MTKFRKYALSALSLVAVLGLASCSNNKEEDKTVNNGGNTGDNGNNGNNGGNEGDKKTEKEIKYQFTGSNTEMASYGFAYSYYLNIYTDGTLDGYGYEMYSLDTTDAATNTKLHKWYDGKWAATKDDDDNEAIRAVVNYVDGLAGATGESIKGKQEVVISYQSDGKTPLNLTNFNIPIGISGRSVSMTYMATPYATANDFIKGTVYQFKEPTDSLAYFEDTVTKERIYCFAEGKGDYYGARLKEDNSLLGYYPKSAASWSYTSNKLTLTLSGSAHEVTLEGTKGTVAWEEAIYGDYKSTYNFVCNDVSKLIAGETKSDTPAYAQGSVYFTYNYLKSYGQSCTFYANYATWSTATGSATAAYVPVEGNTETLLSFTNADANSNGTFVLKKNGTFAFAITLAGNAISKEGTFAFANYTFTFTTTDGSVEVTKTSIQA